MAKPDLTRSPQRKGDPSASQEPLGTDSSPPSRNASADTTGLVFEDRRQIHDGIVAHIPRWKPEMRLVLDKDDEINSENFSEAFAAMSGSSVSTVLCDGSAGSDTFAAAQG